MHDVLIRKIRECQEKAEAECLETAFVSENQQLQCGKLITEIRCLKNTVTAHFLYLTVFGQQKNTIFYSYYITDQGFWVFFVGWFRGFIYFKIVFHFTGDWETILHYSVNFYRQQEFSP